MSKFPQRAYNVGLSSFLDFNVIQTRSLLFLNTKDNVTHLSLDHEHFMKTGY